MTNHTGATGTDSSREGGVGRRGTQPVSPTYRNRLAITRERDPIATVVVEEAESYPNDRPVRTCWSLWPNGLVTALSKGSGRHETWPASKAPDELFEGLEDRPDLTQCSRCETFFERTGDDWCNACADGHDPTPVWAEPRWKKDDAAAALIQKLLDKGGTIP